jgi:hypothetical protein
MKVTRAPSLRNGKFQPHGGGSVFLPLPFCRLTIYPFGGVWSRLTISGRSHANGIALEGKKGRTRFQALTTP